MPSVCGHSFRRGRFALVLASPRQRATRTARIVFPDRDVEPCEDIVEWNYGDYEGITSVEIRKSRPAWDLWTDGAPNGESPAQVTVRVDRLVKRLENVDGDVAVFAHGHILRAFAARWLGLDVTIGRSLLLDTATVSILNIEPDGDRVLEMWNAPAPGLP